MEKDDKSTKTVAAQVDQQLYWQFKKTAAERKETAQEAVIHAILLYVDPEVTDGE